MAKARAEISPTLAAVPQPVWSQLWQTARAAAGTAFVAEPDIVVLWRGLSNACDAAMRSVFEGAQHCAVVAVGSYGRSELLPHSDIDLLILTTDTPSEELKLHITKLWSSGLRIGHAVHTPSSAITAMQSDITALTSYLHPRFVCGDKALYERFVRRKNAWRNADSPVPWIDKLLVHRDARHQRFGDSRFLLEPHVKDGKGGIRDAQMLGWMAYLAYGTRDLGKASDDQLWPNASATAYTHAVQFFSSVRAGLHITAERADERLSFSVQPHIAEMLGYKGDAPEIRAQSFMAEYFRCTRIIGECTRELCTMLDRDNKRTPPFRMSEPAPLPEGLCWRDGRLAVASGVNPAALILPLFAEACARNRDVHPDVMHWIELHRAALREYYATTPEACYPLREILLGAHPDAVLKRLNEAGVLGTLIHEYDHVCGQMQYDGYHTYTVDAHILLVVGNVHALETGAMRADAPVTSQAAKELVNRRALYVAALCHDLAKGTGGGHQDKGVAIAQRVAQMLGLDEAEAELAGWLVKYHQHISDIAFKRDISDPETIAALVSLVQSPERLRLLMVLTVADIRAVGPTIWNGWKASVIRKLFERTMDAMGVRMASHSEGDIGKHPLSEAETTQLAQRGIAVCWQVMQAQAATEMTITAPYSRALLRDCAGALAYIGANIVSARSVMVDETVCRMIFALQDGAGQAFIEEDRLSRIAPLVSDTKSDAQHMQKALATRSYMRRSTTAMPMAPAVFFDQHSSSSATLVEVNAPDRPGLLYDILRVFEASGMQVSNAYIATYGQRVVDVFYMKDRFGLKLRNTGKLEEIKHALLETL